MSEKAVMQQVVALSAAAAGPAAVEGTAMISAAAGGAVDMEVEGVAVAVVARELVTRPDRCWSQCCPQACCYVCNPTSGSQK